MMRYLTMMMLIAAAGLTQGCNTFRLRTPTLDAPLPIEATVEAEPWVPYPGGTEHGNDWDVIVKQGRDSLTLINREPRSIQNVKLWLNQQYVAQVDQINIGSNNRISLAAFHNKHGESYPIPGFLTPDKAFPALACEVFDPVDGKRHRLTRQ